MRADLFPKIKIQLTVMGNNNAPKACEIIIITIGFALKIGTTNPNKEIPKAYTL